MRLLVTSAIAASLMMGCQATTQSPATSSVPTTVETLTFATDRAEIVNACVAYITEGRSIMSLTTLGYSVSEQRKSVVLEKQDPRFVAGDLRSIDVKTSERRGRSCRIGYEGGLTDEEATIVSRNIAAALKRAGWSPRGIQTFAQAGMKLRVSGSTTSGSSSARTSFLIMQARP